MERVSDYSKMLNYLRAHNLISRRQQAFLSRRSTSTNLLECINDWTAALNNKHGVAIAYRYIDYAKAFDIVCHSKLLYKLEAYGIGGDMLKYICSLLSNRTQCTRIGHSYSSYIDVLSGVIQGSVIGPLFFV